MRTFAEKAYGIPPEQVDRTGFMLLFGSLCSILYVTFALTPVSYTELLVAMVLLTTSFLFVSSAQNGPKLFAHSPTVLHLSLRDISVNVILASQNIVDDVEHCLKANCPSSNVEAGSVMIGPAPRAFPMPPA